MTDDFSFARWIDKFHGLIDHDRHNAGGSLVIPANPAPVGGVGPSTTPQPILDLRGDDERAQMVTVAIEAEPNEPLAIGPGVGHSVRVWADVRWGVGGAQHRAEVDVVRGALLSVFASSLQVSVAQESIQLGGVPITIRATASAGYNPRGGPCAPTRTRYTGAIATTTSQVVPVPPYARSMSVYRAPATQAYTVDVEDSAQSVAKLSSASLVAANADLPAHVPLPNDARWVRITCTGAAGITDARVIFDLSI